MEATPPCALRASVCALACPTAKQWRCFANGIPRIASRLGRKRNWLTSSTLREARPVDKRASSAVRQHQLFAWCGRLNARPHQPHQHKQHQPRRFNQAHHRQTPPQSRRAFGLSNPVNQSRHSSATFCGRGRRFAITRLGLTRYENHRKAALRLLHLSGATNHNPHQAPENPLHARRLA